MIRKIIYGICTCWFIAVLTSCGRGGEIPPLDETYSYNDKNPFGAYVLHKQIQQYYFHNTIRKVNHDFNKNWRDITDTNALYINISKHLFLTRQDLTAMLAFVYNGNSLFISSDQIDKRLLDTLGCTVSRASYRRRLPEFKTTAVSLSNSFFSDTAGYQYYYFPFYNHFTEMDTLHTRVLGKNGSGINYVVVFYGKGHFFLHLEPRAFSNYFLLQKNNYQYFNKVFSFTPAIPEHVFWDNYYHKRNYPRNESGNKSRLSVLLQYPSFEWAFWLLLFLAGTYLFFGGRRRQRIVAPIVPNTNTTVNFTETIGRLYLQQKNNRNIADKLVTYFLEYIRNHYYLNTSHANEAFIESLSRKSNNTKEGTENLFNSIRAIQQSLEISDQQLLSLNQQIEKFYKNKL